MTLRCNRSLLRSLSWPLSRPLSRRRAIALLGAPLILGGVGKVSMIPPASPAPPGPPVPYSMQLKAALDALEFRHRPSRLDLVSFQEQAEPTRVVMTARVHFHWPPGTRQRRFRVEAEDAQQAFADLEGRISTYFTSLG